MVRDVFGRIVETPRIIKVEVLDDRVIEAIERGGGAYSDDLIIKPSVFKTIEREELGTCPLFVEMIH